MSASDWETSSVTVELIPAIDQFCDQWCMRCPFTRRCERYLTLVASSPKEFAPTPLPTPEIVTFWHDLEDTLQGTIALLHQMMDRLGLELDSANSLEMQLFDHKRKGERGHHELTRAAELYVNQVDAWFSDAKAVLEEKDEFYRLMEQQPVSAFDLGRERQDFQEAVDVIRWYQFLIHAKLERALYLRMEDPPTGSRYGRRELLPLGRWDGLAKVALLAIERSLSAWGRVLNIFPERELQTLQILLHLNRLRRMVEFHFPRARSFSRPGFDTVVIE